MSPAERLTLAYLLAIAGDARPLAERLAQVDADLAAAAPRPDPDAVLGTRSTVDPRTGKRTIVDYMGDGRELPREDELAGDRASP